MRILDIIPAVIAVWSAPVECVGQGAEIRQGPPRIEFRLAEEAPAPGLTEAEVLGERVYLRTEVELSNKHLAHVRAVKREPGLLLEVWLTKEGSKRLAGLTAANVGRRLAVVIDTRPVTAAVIVEELRQGTDRPISVAAELPEEEASRLMQAVAGAWPPRPGD